MKKVKRLMWSYGGMILIGSLIMSLTLATTVLSAPAKEGALPFKIGVVTSLSGAGYGYGQRAVLGVRYRVEQEINKGGGINGHPVQLIIYDTATRADQAAMLAERAATVDKVFAILGPNSSSDVAAVFPTAKRLGISDIAMGGGLRGVCESHAPWCFSTMVDSDFAMEPLALLIDQYKAKNMIIMVDAKYNAAISQGEYTYKMAERKGIKVLHDKGKLDVETGWADFTPQVTRIISLRPDVIFAMLFPVDLAHLAIGLKGAGIDAKTVPCFGAQMLLPEMILAGGEAADGWYGSGDFDVDSKDPLQLSWQARLTDYGKSITTDAGIYMVQFNHACGYDAAAFLCEAIKRTRIAPNTPLQEARTKIRDELSKITMTTYSQVPFRFSTGGRHERNRLMKPAFLFQAKGGQLVTVGEVK